MTKEQLAKAKKLDDAIAAFEFAQTQIDQMPAKCGDRNFELKLFNLTVEQRRELVELVADWIDEQKEYAIKKFSEL